MRDRLDLASKFPDRLATTQEAGTKRRYVLKRRGRRWKARDAGPRRAGNAWSGLRVPSLRRSGTAWRRRGTHSAPLPCSLQIPVSRHAIPAR